jgi:hypothetical protein
LTPLYQNPGSAPVVLHVTVCLLLYVDHVCKRLLVRPDWRSGKWEDTSKFCGDFSTGILPHYMEAKSIPSWFGLLNMSRPCRKLWHFLLGNHGRSCTFANICTLGLKSGLSLGQTKMTMLLCVLLYSYIYAGLHRPRPQLTKRKQRQCARAKC